ncbi:MAG TPA: thioesterase family protein [Acidimicrobiales bacterium]|nr:thioesterase family protein [Acidimicrobiales bacterium]
MAVGTIESGAGFVHHMAAPDEGHPRGTHLTNLGVAQVLFEARNALFLSLDIEGGIWSQPVTPLIRELLIRYESEVMPGAPLACPIVVVSRSRRAFVMEESVTDISDPGAPRLVATCRGVHVAFDSARGTSVDVPDILIRAIEVRQGAAIPRAGGEEPSPA